MLQSALNLWVATLEFREILACMDELFEASFEMRKTGGKPFVRCGLTHRYLELIETRPMRLYNPDTEQVYRLPAGGVVKQWNGDSCPVCHFELCLFATGERSYPLCPYCISSHQEEWGEQALAHVCTPAYCLLLTLVPTPG